MKLRLYQESMIAAIRHAWASGHQAVMGVLPTGGGKTEVAIAILKADASPSSRVLVVTDRKVLCKQWAGRLRRHGAGHVGVLQADNTIGLSAPIIVATIQTIRRRGIPDGVALVVIDEAHILHEHHDRFFDGQRRVLGLTATPLRAGLGLRFTTSVVGASIRDLMHDGHLVPARYFAPGKDSMARALQDINVRAGDYDAGQLSKLMQGKAILGDVVSTWQRLGQGRQTIAFCVDKAHARELTEEFKAAGVPAALVVDETEDEERLKAFTAFEGMEVRVLVSVGVLSIGFDSPLASCAILARPTKSQALYIQQGGRVLRPSPGKLDAIILDHANSVGLHGRLEDFVPPTDLSRSEKEENFGANREPSTLWSCNSCDAINERGQDMCCECGEPRRRRTRTVVLNGDLVEVDVEDADVAFAVTLEEVQSFYTMTLWHARSRGLQDGFAFHATKRRFRFDDKTAKNVIRYAWRRLELIPPDEFTSRWLRADQQRSAIARKARRAA